MNIGNIKSNAEGVLIGRIQTMAFGATVALSAVTSTNERAPAYDVMALASDRRSWVKIGAMWEYHSNDTGETFLSGRIDDPSLEKPIDVAMFRQDDGSFNVAWRRPQRKLTTPVNTGEDTLPPLDAVSGDTGTNGAADADNAGGDGLGGSTAPAPKAKAKAPAKKENAGA